MAAEYYLCYLSGNYSKEQLLERAKKEYGGNCPTSIAIFERLLLESKIPEDYNEWLIGQFESNQYPSELTFRPKAISFSVAQYIM